MLDEPPPYELPARASATAGASARFALKMSARKMRQFSSRLDIVPPIQCRGRGMLCLIWVPAQRGGSTSEGNIASPLVVARFARRVCGAVKDSCAGICADGHL